jgi:predicted CoA-binding protein
MPEVSRTFYAGKDVSASISEIKDGIDIISGFVTAFGIPLTNSQLMMKIQS